MLPMYSAALPATLADAPNARGEDCVGSAGRHAGETGWGEKHRPPQSCPTANSPIFWWPQENCSKIALDALVAQLDGVAASPRKGFRQCVRRIFRQFKDHHKELGTLRVATGSGTARIRADCRNSTPFGGSARSWSLVITTPLTIDGPTGTPCRFPFTCHGAFTGYSCSSPYPGSSSS